MNDEIPTCYGSITCYQLSDLFRPIIRPVSPVPVKLGVSENFTIFQGFVAYVPTLEHVSSIKFTNIYLYIYKQKDKERMKDRKVISLNIKYFVLVLYSIEYKSKRNYKTFISLYIYVLHSIPTFYGVVVVVKESSLWNY